MKELTARQRELLEFIQDHLQIHGFPPSIREMADHMGIKSTNGVNDHLKALERKGFIQRKEGLKSRAITLTNPNFPNPRQHGDPNTVAIPIMGQVAAGAPVLSEQNNDGHLFIGQSMLEGNGDTFALKIRGDSMIGEGIFEGDYVFVHQQNTARSGQIVVAMIDGEATVKTYRPTSTGITFEPANPNVQAIEVENSEFTNVDILGVVKGVFRKLS